PWMQGVRTIALLVLLSAVVTALCARGRPRAFATGVAVFGWALFYLLVAHAANPSELPSNDLLRWVYSGIAGPPPDLGPDTTPSVEDFEYFSRQTCFTEIGNLTFVVGLSLLGGIVGVFAHSRLRGDDKTSP